MLFANSHQDSDFLFSLRPNQREDGRERERERILASKDEEWIHFNWNSIGLERKGIMLASNGISIAIERMLTSETAAL